jgi:hypothetical protein
MSYVRSRCTFDMCDVTPVENKATEFSLKSTVSENQNNARIRLLKGKSKVQRSLYALHRSKTILMEVESNRVILDQPILRKF